MSIKRPDQFTNQFSKHESEEIKAVIYEVKKYLDLHGRESRFTYDIPVFRKWVRDDVRARISKDLRYRGWKSYFDLKDDGYTVRIIAEDRFRDDASSSILSEQDFEALSDDI